MPDSTSETHPVQAGIEEVTGQLVTGWVFVAEVIDPTTGQPQLAQAKSSRLPGWAALGMLAFATRFHELQVEGPDRNED